MATMLCSFIEEHDLDLAWVALDSSAHTGGPSVAQSFPLLVHGHLFSCLCGSLLPSSEDSEGRAAHEPSTDNVGHSYALCPCPEDLLANSL